MDLSQGLPIWNKLTDAEKKRITDAADYIKVKKGTHIHDSSADCLGLLVICSGQLRTYFLSEEGREITLNRLFEYDVCLLSTSCVMPNMQFNIMIEAEKDSEFWSIPACLYKNLMDESLAVSNFSNALISNHFSELMWLMEQVMWKSVDKRLAEFLLNECNLEGSDTLTITHEKIANHLGTAREVVTRMLRYFQSEGFVKLTRGNVIITNSEGLENLLA